MQSIIRGRSSPRLDSVSGRNCHDRLQGLSELRSSSPFSPHVPRKTRTVDDLVTMCGAMCKEQRPNDIHGRIKTADQSRGSWYRATGQWIILLKADSRLDTGSHSLRHGRLGKNGASQDLSLHDGEIDEGCAGSCQANSHDLFGNMGK